MNQLVKTIDLVILVHLVIVLGDLAERGEFDDERGTVIGRLAIGFALPATLFVPTISVGAYPPTAVVRPAGVGFGDSSCCGRLGARRESA
jgi:hypothetical protein